jgi:hypothetical protein
MWFESMSIGMNSTRKKILVEELYRYAVREATPKEVWARATNTILNCISNHSSYKH